MRSSVSAMALATCALVLPVAYSQGTGSLGVASSTRAAPVSAPLAPARVCEETFSGARVIEVNAQRQRVSERFGAVGGNCLRAAMVDVGWVELNLSRQSGMLWLQVQENPTASVRHAQVQVVTQNDGMTLWVTQAANPAAEEAAEAPTAKPTAANTLTPSSVAETPAADAQALEETAPIQAIHAGATAAYPTAPKPTAMNTGLAR